jgi:hypothetical protein
MARCTLRSWGSRGTESETQLVPPLAVGNGRPVATQVQFGLEVQRQEFRPLRWYNGAILGKNGILPGKEVLLWQIMAVIHGYPHPDGALGRGVGR